MSGREQLGDWLEFRGSVRWKHARRRAGRRRAAARAAALAARKPAERDSSGWVDEYFSPPAEQPRLW